jgi:hypothetical protein
MSDTGLSFNTISQYLGETARAADDLFAATMKDVSDHASTDVGLNTQNMIKLQAASQQWAFKLDAVAKAQEKLGETFNKIVQKS